jgi:hypothetical protein
LNPIDLILLSAWMLAFVLAGALAFFGTAILRYIEGRRRIARRLRQVRG